MDTGWILILGSWGVFALWVMARRYINRGTAVCPKCGGAGRVSE